MDANLTPQRALFELLAQHGELRDLMSHCERLADELDAGRIEAVVLLDAVTRLRLFFDAHNQFEELFLRPILREVDSFGDVRLDSMVSGHIGEHRLVQERLETGVTGELRQTIHQLRGHLATEEHYFLSSKVVRDDLVTVEGGG